ncbi:MAG: hypothetical protein EOL87_15705 [Spartobacteria bacterium]|nr:hypothetical protein [Spartobacteria bacterium]
MSGTNYRVTVFGKEGCDKCSQLKNRLSKMINKGQLADVDMDYKDVLTVDGVVDFSELECLNPQRIPAMVVSRYSSESGRYEAIENPRPGEADAVCKKSRLYHIMGVQTDYSLEGRGIITPEMIAHVVTEAQRC